MRIERIHIDGFGHFADKTFGPFNSQVTIFEGANEAGKSTLLAFIRTILYGFPTRNRDEHYPPMRGGKHGGRIVVADGSGDVFPFARKQRPPDLNDAEIHQLDDVVGTDQDVAGLDVVVDDTGVVDVVEPYEHLSQNLQAFIDAYPARPLNFAL